jgi:SAM-dependent methyltransferase
MLGYGPRCEEVHEDAPIRREELPMIQSFKRKLKRILRRRIDFGDLSRTTPVSRHFGFDRGTPIDRYYIESFLAENAAAIRGRTLEIGDDEYTRRFGAARASQRDVLHVHSENPKATLIGDISTPGVLPASAFDCAVITQTLHLIYDMRAALENLREALKPGGTLLLTSPGITQISVDEWRHTWYWSLTPAGARRLFADVFSKGQVELDFYGNVFAAIAFLTGAASEEVPRRKLDVKDECYPVLVGVRATRASN